jgi:hypothetical protein
VFQTLKVGAMAICSSNFDEGFPVSLWTQDYDMMGRSMFILMCLSPLLVFIGHYAVSGVEQVLGEET